MKPLQRVKYKEFIPSGPLSKYLKCYWNLEDMDPAAPPAREKVFPDGCIELIFHYGDRFKKYESADGFVIQHKSFIHGQLTKYIELEPTGRIGVFGARFHPGGLQPFITTPVNDLTHKTVALTELWQQQGQELETAVLKAATHPERQALVEAFLLKRLDTSRDKGIAIHLVNEILKTDGNVKIDELAATLSIGKRQLERTFVACVGLKPKMLARIVRFSRVLRLIENGELASFTKIAYEGGFYDQAHFIKDFKEITGLNPKKYFSENLEMARFFNL